MNDTSPQAEQILLERYRAMSPKDKLLQVVALTRSTQKMALSRIRKQYGNISEGEELLRLAALWLPRKTMIHFFDWDPEEKGY